MKLTLTEFVPGGRQRRSRVRMFSRHTTEPVMIRPEHTTDSYQLTVDAPGGKLTLDMSRQEVAQLAMQLMLTPTEHIIEDWHGKVTT